MGDEKSTHPSLHPPLHGYLDADAAPPPSGCSWVLLDLYPYIADRENSTSAYAEMSHGEKIRVTLCAAPPPLVSYVCVWCPGLAPAEIHRVTLEAAESDLLLVRVTLRARRGGLGEFFVYKASASKGPSLWPLQMPLECLDLRFNFGLLAHRDVVGVGPRGKDDDARPPMDGSGGRPRPQGFGGGGRPRPQGFGGGGARLLSQGESCGVGLHSHGDGCGVGLHPHGDGNLAGIRSHGPGGGVRLSPYVDGNVVRFRPHEKGNDHYFVAALYYESQTDEATSFNLWVYNSTDEKWVILPISLPGDLPFQYTAKVIVLGQGGQLGFVDPWRGIIICDVLGFTPPSYLPVPKQLVRHDRVCDEPQLSRDVVLIDDDRLTLVDLCSVVEPGTYADCWTWQVSAWSRSVSGQEDWCCNYEFQSGDILVDEDTDNVCLLPKMRDHEGMLRPTLERLYVAHPMQSLDDSHVVYIMGKVGEEDSKALVLSIDVRRPRLLGVSVFDGERMYGIFSYTCTQSRIPEYFNAGAKRNLKRPGQFNVGYPFKHWERIRTMNDLSSDVDEEQQDNVMDLD